MSPDGRIMWEREGLVATALIDRPPQRNALSANLCDDLRGCLESNRDLRALVVGGTGDRAFCAGADLVRRSEDAGGLEHGGGDSFRPAFEQLLDEIVAFPAPVIAAVNGVALGAGMQLAVACDLRVVAPTASFGIPAARLGVLISAPNARRLVNVVGLATAQDLLFTARILSFADARGAGLVQRPAENAVADAQELAREIASLAPGSMCGHKEMLRRLARGGALSDDDRFELSALEARAFASTDFSEGLAAFREKRPPHFRGC